MDFPQSDFWDFTLKIYGKEGVSPAVIALQDRHGLDVDILLFCCFLAATGKGRLDASDVSRARAVADPWQRDVVNAVRIVRLKLKEGFQGTPAGLPETLRKEIFGQELAAERIEQMMLEAAVPRAADAGKSPDARLADAAHNLAAYLKDKGVKAGAEEASHLATLARAALDAAPDAASQAIASALR